MSSVNLIKEMSAGSTEDYFGDTFLGETQLHG